MTDRASVVYVLPDKMGGMMNIVANLLQYRQADGMDHHAVLTHNVRDVDTRHGQRLAADSQTTVEYTLPEENLHAVLRRIDRAVPAGGGVYVAADLLDLAAASVHDFGRAVVYMLHGNSDYCYDLAVKHDSVVHAFIAYSQRMYEQLLTRLPHRADRIFHLRYGIPVPSVVRRPSAGALRAIFAGRLEEQKGVFTLPDIDRRLTAAGVPVQWTIAGSGPDEAELKRRWAFNADVRWLGRLTTDQLHARYADQDIFVLPTRGEGFPVALLEAMGAGVVPVVSDVESGVPEVVTSGVTGERVAIADPSAFAAAIAVLAQDRGRLKAQGAAAREAVVTRFDIRDRVADYQALYARWREFYRPMAPGHHLQYGSRLDQPWIPNPLVRLVRTAIRAGKHA